MSAQKTAEQKFSTTDVIPRTEGRRNVGTAGERFVSSVTAESIWVSAWLRAPLPRPPGCGGQLYNRPAQL